jgi:transcriptional regulator with XRE-family HTH domain
MPKSRGPDAEAVFLELVREIRTEAGLRQQDVADRLGQPQSVVSKYESGDRRLDVLELREVCAACNLTLTEFARRLERKLGEPG